MGFAFKFCIVAVVISAIFAENGMNGKAPGQKSREKCSEYGKLQDLVKFSYAGLIGMGERDTIIWVCSGSLISEKFVLTVANCARHKIKWVRLGNPAYYTQQKIFEVSAFTVHPDYSWQSFYNDIGLIELKEHVDINLKTPICLDTKEVQPELLFIAGWIYDYGTSKQYNFHIMKAARYTNEDCTNEQMQTYSSINGLNNETHMCAKSLEKSVLYCRSSHGGALQSTEKNIDNHLTYSIVGITSFGKVVFCEKSTIYTRIFPFLSWIENIVWP